MRPSIIFYVPRAGLEPARPQGTEDFKSPASTIPPPRQNCVSFMHIAQRCQTVFCTLAKLR